MNDGEADIEFTPDFSGDVTAYTATIADSISDVVVSITPEYGTPDITVAVGETEITAEEDGTYIVSTALAEDNELEITVTSEVGTDDETYTFTITIDT